VADCVLAGPVEGIFAEGESMVVRGVRYVLELLTAAMAFCCAGALKSEDELVLAWELAEPTVLSVSSVSDSVSSVWGGAASATKPFV